MTAAYGIHHALARLEELRAAYPAGLAPDAAQALDQLEEQLRADLTTTTATRPIGAPRHV